MMLGEFQDGVWLVELAPLASPDLVLRKVAAVLAIPETAGISLSETLVASLQRRRLLLLLDNCEHLVETCASLTHTLLSACPDLKVLTTSREPLHVPGETVYSVPPLETTELITSPDSAGQSEAVRLFVERAHSALPSFSITAENLSTIAQICSRLDGLPLAIELAAAWVRTLPVETIHARLDQAFQLLTTGSRSASPKHQTLRAALDRSYDLLSKPEQALFRRLGVFAGGFTLDMAEDICRDEGDEREISFLDLFSLLVDKSLVTVLLGEGRERRYRLLETVRQYAVEKLSEAGEWPDLRDRHFAEYVALAEEIEAGLSQNPLAGLDRLEAELDNLRLALDWAYSGEGMAGAVEGLRLAVAMGRFWADRCYFAEGRAWIERGVAGLDVDDPTHASLLGKAYLTAGNLASEQIEPKESRRLLERSVELSRQSGDLETLSQALLLLGFVVYVLKEREKAHAFVDESLAICRAIDYHWGLAMALAVKGRLLSLRDTRFEEARRCTQESMQLFLETGDRLEAFANYSQSGWIDYWTGKYAQARTNVEAALAVYRQNKDRAAMAYACGILTSVTYMLQDFPAMITFAEEAVDHRRWIGHQIQAIDDLFWLGIARIELGQFSMAVECCPSTIPGFSVRTTGWISPLR